MCLLLHVGFQEKYTCPPYPFTAQRQFLQGQITDFGIGSTNNPPIDIFFILITCLLDVLNGKEKFYIGHSCELQG